MLFIAYLVSEHKENFISINHSQLLLMILRESLSFPQVMKQRINTVKDMILLLTFIPLSHQ